MNEGHYKLVRVKHHVDVNHECIDYMNFVIFYDFGVKRREKFIDDVGVHLLYEFSVVIIYV